MKGFPLTLENEGKTWRKFDRDYPVRSWLDEHGDSHTLYGNVTCRIVRNSAGGISIEEEFASTGECGNG